MKARDVIAALDADGWREVRSKGSHKQFRHPTKPGTVTIPAHGGQELKIGTVAAIERQSGVQLRRR